MSDTIPQDTSYSQTPPPGKVFIYALCHPITKEIRYVGKTKMNTHRRLLCHLSEKGQNRKVRWIALLKREGLIPEIIVLDTVDECMWEEAERYWIAYHRELGYDLTNLTVGGDGVHDPSEEARQRLSASLKEKWENDAEFRARMLDVLGSPEKRAASSRFHKGREHPSEQTAKQVESRRGWRPNEQTIENMRLAAQKRTAQEIADGTFKLGKREITEQQRLKIGMASKGRKYPNRRRWTEEEKLQRSLKQKGRPHTESHSQAIAEGQKRRWERQRQENPESIEAHKKACRDGYKRRLERIREEKEKTNGITLQGLWGSLADDSAV